MNIVAAVSLLLCLASAVLWLRSHWAHDAVSYTTEQGYVWVGGRDGEVHVYWRVMRPPEELWGWNYERSGVGDVRSVLGPADREVGPVEFWDWRPDWWVCVRCWGLVAVFAIAPAAWLVIQRPLERRRRLKQGLCGECGYDLRATPGKCPECGSGSGEAETVGRGPPYRH
jgi:hypothetical protein